MGPGPVALASPRSSLPASLPDIRLEQLQEDTVSDETRRRHKFLAHLPLGTPICFADVDLRNHLSRDTREAFAEEFAKRRALKKKEQQRTRNQSQKKDPPDQDLKCFEHTHRSILISNLPYQPICQIVVCPCAGLLAFPTQEAGAVVQEQVEGRRGEVLPEPEPDAPNICAGPANRRGLCRASSRQARG